jgi:hypothetical protein
LNKKAPTISIVFYVIAGLLFLYAIWSTIFSYNYLAPIMASGQLVAKGNEYEIVSFYMSNLAQPLFFAIVVFALGWLIQLVSGNDKFEDLEVMEVEVVETDDMEDVAAE